MSTPTSDASDARMAIRDGSGTRPRAMPPVNPGVDPSLLRTSMKRVIARLGLFMTPAALSPPALTVLTADIITTSCFQTWRQWRSGGGHNE